VQSAKDGTAARGAIFLDRDGTLNRKAPEGEYIRKAEDLCLLPGAGEAVRLINTAGIPAILITNQRWLSGPLADLAAYQAVTTRLDKLLADDGGHLDAIYVCPHAADSCDCRKPAPGLLLRASKDLGINLAASVMIGDSSTDMAAGNAAGTANVLIGSGNEPPNSGAPAYMAGSISQAVSWAIMWIQAES
jgi:D-glycero-D-manno-heptose 1,7-bisphosphate phosphatase